MSREVHDMPCGPHRASRCGICVPDLRTSSYLGRVVPSRPSIPYPLLQNRQYRARRRESIQMSAQELRTRGRRYEDPCAGGKPTRISAATAFRTMQLTAEVIAEAPSR